MFGLVSAGACCGWYLDNLWLCWVGVWAVPGCNACQMLPLQASQETLWWHEPTGTILYIQVCTGTFLYILVCTGMYWYILVFTSFTFFNSCVEGLGCVQDTIVVVPPYPYSIADDIADVTFGDCWYAQPQLLLKCHLCPTPTGWLSPKNTSYKIGPDDLLFNLVFFSTFEELNLPIHGPMEDAEVMKLC
jgi:hypothetical protein